MLKQEIEHGEKVKEITSPLPIYFVTIVFIIAILNIQNFKDAHAAAMEENEEDIQLAYSSIESKYVENFSGKDNYVDLNGWFSNVIDKHYVNDVYKLDNGYLTSSLNTYYKQDVGADNIDSLDKYLQAIDIPHVYVNVPTIFETDDDEQIPSGYNSYVNKMDDELLVILEEKGVEYIDLRENAIEENRNFYDLFYKTDNHWTSSTALWAADIIAEYLDIKMEDVNRLPEYGKLENYHIRGLDVNILGGQGYRVGMYYGGTSKLDVIVPKFDTYFELEVPSRSIIKTGTFEELFVEYELYSENFTARGPESIYFGENLEYRKIVNYNANNEYKILVVNDSFSLPLIPFLSLQFKETHMYDVREQFGGSAQGLSNKIAEIQPDYVVRIRDKTALK